MTNKLGSGHVNEGHVRSLEDQLYAEAMAHAVRSRPQERNLPTHFNGKPVGALSEEEREAFYLSMQPASTKEMLRRDPKDDDKWVGRLNGPLPEGWKAVPDADFTTPEGRNLAVGKRELDHEQVLIVQDIRQKGRNSLGDSKDSSITKESRERAVNAFTYSRPADPAAVDLARLKKLTEMEAVQVSAPEEPKAPEKRRWWERLLGLPEPEGSLVRQSVKFQGNKMVITTEKVDADRD